jgi:gliding motility-associated lipoprotein GldH
MRKLIYLWICIGLTSCLPSDNAILNESATLPESGWNMKQPVCFEMEVKNTAQLYDIYITLRHNTDYECMNLFLFLKTYYPNQEYSRDTLECFLADETGRWFGKGSSSMKSCEMLFKRGVKFPQEGRYTFEFVQGMRTESVKNIMDLGMKIVPTSD